jgi:hypothetical protein
VREEIRHGFDVLRDIQLLPRQSKALSEPSEVQDIDHIISFRYSMPPNIGPHFLAAQTTADRGLHRHRGYPPDKTLIT